ncbi:M43 family zinc metalloprotease [Pontibacter sp. E15-1]|uniref:M43 family zinc metalloprotease n=1 Tax=Pontibacter sp. E15-1 TaxID=2919918 RepID=UPI001F5020F0|nr:M43 family zinc metalloprotease [Pontibacter sp. E15-1]MCJ8163843.1 M43 family zinc metalloprotease [Pontibacter sp. E15-1]
MRTLTLLAIFLIGFAAASQAQQVKPAASGHTCATDAYSTVLQAQDPGFETRRQQMQQQVQQALRQQQQGKALQADVVITVPVVFHVVYRTQTENISDAALLSQLEVLNADFRRLNADTVNTPDYFRPFAADTKIQLCLATINPNGDKTSGITRTQTSVNDSFGYGSDKVKFTGKGGTDAWDSNQYLNIWVCNLDNGILGYASVPGAKDDIDGVVLDYIAVGSAPINQFESNYNKGRTGTHEVGHWLGLQHIWGNGLSCADSDDIADTPNQKGENTGCNTGIQMSCEGSPFGDMYQNYMDYSDDACMNIFTKGQASYMQTLLATSRSGILSSLACGNTLRSDFKFRNPSDTLVAAGDEVRFVSASAGIRPETWFWEFEGGIPATSSQLAPTVTYPQPGRYSVRLTISNGSQNSTAVKEDFVHVTVNDLVVYPNPATDYITIEQPARVQVLQLELVSQLGQVLVREKTQDRVLRLDVRHLRQGVYILRIRSSNGTEVRKISVLR